MYGRRTMLVGMALPVVIVAMLCLSCARTPASGQVTLVNGADDPITHAEVSVCNQTITFEGIPPQGKRAARFEVRADSGYQVRVVFASGSKISGEVGYVTPGADTSITIVATETTVSVGFAEFR